jgi:hypothetical protein
MWAPFAFRKGSRRFPARPVHPSVVSLTAVTALSARRLVVAYAAILALFDLAVMLPGNPISGVEEFIVAVAVQALIVWRLWHGSSFAWLFAMFFALGYVVTLILIQPSLEVGVVLTYILAVAQAAILWSRPVKALVSDATSALEPLGR